MRGGDDDEMSYDDYDDSVDDVVKLRVMIKMKSTVLIIVKDGDNHDDGDDSFLLHK